MNLEELISYKDGRGRLLGIDHGERRIGLALSDTTWMIATPYKIIEYRHIKGFFKEFEKIQKDFHVMACIIGLPVNMNGSRGPQSQKAEHFGEELTTHTGIKVFFWDERWSTIAVERMMIDADLSRAKRAKHRDAAAAAYILQGVLDSLPLLSFDNSC